MKIKIGLIGFGRMGRFYLTELQKNPNYEITYICDSYEGCRKLAAELSPESKIVADDNVIFEDPEVQVVALCALADSRLNQILRAVKHGKHVISEKPIADCIENEWKVVEAVEQSDLFCTVNLYLRNSWYHNVLRDFIRTGEIGDLAIIRVCHMTPGLSPGEGHEAEGPAFHDCGMHYVDIARWYAGSEYKTWHSQGIRMWNYKDPWWVQCHGTFENGVVYDITQGFVYGQLSKDQTHNSYIDLIGTKGIARMTHDFKQATVTLRGVTVTQEITRPFGGKNIDKLVELMAQSILTGKRAENMPSMRDAAVASEESWKFLKDSYINDLPVKGDLDILEQIHYRRAHMTNGYGLLPKK